MKSYNYLIFILAFLTLGFKSDTFEIYGKWVFAKERTTIELQRFMENQEMELGKNDIKELVDSLDSKDMWLSFEKDGTCSMLFIKDVRTGSYTMADTLVLMKIGKDNVEINLDLDTASREIIMNVNSLFPIVFKKED